MGLFSKKKEEVKPTQPKPSENVSRVDGTGLPWENAEPYKPKLERMILVSSVPRDTLVIKLGDSDPVLYMQARKIWAYAEKKDYTDRH